MGYIKNECNSVGIKIETKRDRHSSIDSKCRRVSNNKK